MPLDVQAYLRRIGYGGDTAPTADNLAALQYAHLTHVPYENLDIIRGVPLSLSVDALYDKIVTHGRGGYCFELNELFAWLLRELGYEVTDYFARFLADTHGVLPKRRHHVLGVCIPGTDVRYMADVGVGVGSPNWPLRLEYGTEQTQGTATYRMDMDTFLGWVVKVDRGSGWASLFSFTEEPQLPVDFEAISFYCEHAPASPFNKEAMVALRTGTGRYTLDGDMFKHFDGDQVTTWVEETDAARAQTLERVFGIVLD